MGAKAKRDKHKDELRREILNAARALCINEGYEKFSMRKLAGKIGYSPTTIYFYFRDKDDLLFAICEEVAEHFFAHLTTIRKAYGNPLESLRQALLCLIEFGFNNPNEFRVLFLKGHEVYGTLDAFMEEESMARHSYFVFREIVRDCIVAGELQEIDIDVLTQALTLAAHGLVALTVYEMIFPSVDRNILAHTLVEGLLRGFGNRLFSNANDRCFAGIR